MSGTCATLDTEWSILLAACSPVPSQQKRTRLRPLLQQPVRWKRLFSLAHQHGTQPLLRQALSGLEEAGPNEELRFLEQSYQANLHKALLLSRELIRIIEHLSGRGIEAMPYKGLALAETLYGDIALRQSGDIDLMIHPQDLGGVRDTVRELGYTPHQDLSEIEERAYLKSGYECTFDSAAGRNLLEVQWAIQPRFYAVDLALDDLFRRAVEVTVAGHPMRTPSPEDLLLVLSVHAAKHVWDRLLWLCDVAQLMNLPGLDWGRINLQAEDLGTVRILSLTILTANRLLGVVIPDAAKEGLAEDAATLALAEEIPAHIVTENEFDVESPAYFRLMMRLREQRRDQLRFLTRLVFTPGPGEWQAVRLPESLFPLYRAVRLSRLAAKLVGA